MTARLSTGETGRFDYLVGADGGASFVRKAVGVAFPGTTDESFRLLLGDVAAPELDRGSGYWFAAADDPRTGVALTPLPGTGYFQFGTPLGEGDDVSLEALQAMLDKFSAGVRLTGLGWSTVWRPNVRLAERYRAGRVFLAGDAAHVHPPTGGQGMNTGVQDAYNLGWKLAAETALDTYETERRAVAARVLGVSTELLDRFAQGHPEAHKRGEESFGLDITYRAADAAGPLVTGDRAPDAPVLDRGRRAHPAVRPLPRSALHPPRLRRARPGRGAHPTPCCAPATSRPAAGTTSSTRRATHSRLTRHRRETAY